MKRPREFTKREYLEVKEFLSSVLRKSQKQIACILQNALIGVFPNYVTNEGKFYNKVYMIIYDIRTWKQGSVAKTYIITENSKGEMLLQESYEE